MFAFCFVSSHRSCPITPHHFVAAKTRKQIRFKLYWLLLAYVTESSSTNPAAGRKGGSDTLKQSVRRADLNLHRRTVTVKSSQKGNHQRDKEHTLARNARFVIHDRSSSLPESKTLQTGMSLDARNEFVQRETPDFLAARLYQR